MLRPKEVLLKVVKTGVSRPNVLKGGVLQS